jgi:hypothetical protein
MNKIVVIGVVAVVMVAVLAAILLNHPNSNNSNYNSINTIVTPTTPTTTNVTTPTTTTVSPTTSAITNTTTSTSVNTSLNLPMNSFYFIGENSSGYYYIFVLNLTSYEEFIQQASVPKTTIIAVSVQQGKGMTVTQTVQKEDYLFVIGSTTSNISFSLGNNYFMSFITNSGAIYTIEVTYEGNWTGSIP